MFSSSPYPWEQSIETIEIVPVAQIQKSAPRNGFERKNDLLVGAFDIFGQGNIDSRRPILEVSKEGPSNVLVRSFLTKLKIWDDKVVPGDLYVTISIIE